MADIPEDATHCIYIAVYVNVKSDEEAGEVADKILDRIPTLEDIPEIVQATPHRIES